MSPVGNHPSGGYKIGAGEVENALLEHPAVAEVVVAGETDGAALTEHVAALLAPHKRPREVRFVESLPRNDMGKVVKARLPR